MFCFAEDAAKQGSLGNAPPTLRKTAAAL